MKKALISVMFLLLFIVMVSCSFTQKRIQPAPKITNSKLSQSTIFPSPTQTILPLLTLTHIIATNPVNFTQTPLATTTKTQQVDGTATPVPTFQCPYLLSPDVPFLLDSGSLITLNPAYDSKSSDSIWAFSKKMKEPYNVIQNALSLTYAYLSPDGEKLAWHAFNDVQKATDKLVVHDLTNGKEQILHYQPNWKNITGWIDNHTVGINIETHSTPSNGIQKIYAAYNIQSSTVVTETVDLDLPGYFFWPPNPWWGFASLDPKGELVLYTACDQSNCGVVMRNIQTGKDVWKTENGHKPYAPASWTENGEKVVFSMMSPNNQEAQLVLINRDGKGVKIYTPLDEERVIRDVSFSPDGHYVYFAEWWSADHGPGYVLDVNTGEIRNICTPGYLLGSARWLPESNQLVYTVRKGNDPLDLGIMELRILDLDSWTTQVLATGENKETNFRFIGWTPIEFP